MLNLILVLLASVAWGGEESATPLTCVILFGPENGNGGGPKPVHTNINLLIDSQRSARVAAEFLVRTPRDTGRALLVSVQASSPLVLSFRLPAFFVLASQVRGALNFEIHGELVKIEGSDPTQALMKALYWYGLLSSDHYAVEKLTKEYILRVSGINLNHLRTDTAVIHDLTQDWLSLYRIEFDPYTEPIFFENKGANLRLDLASRLTFGLKYMIEKNYRYVPPDVLHDLPGRWVPGPWTVEEQKPQIKPVMSFRSNDSLSPATLDLFKFLRRL